MVFRLSRLNAVAREQNGYRLTLQSGTSVPSTDQANATTVYLTPHVSNAIGLYYAGSWALYEPGEIFLALGTLTATRPYDVFARTPDGMSVILEFLAWSNGTTRATALTRQDGVLVKTGDATSRYVGTFYTSSTTQTQDTAAKRFLWNASNRVWRPSTRFTATAMWARTTNTKQAANSGDSVFLAEFIRGLNEDTVTCISAVFGQTDPSSIADWALGLDSSTIVSPDANASAINQNDVGTLVAVYQGLPGLGYHYLQAIDFNAANTGTANFYGTGQTSAGSMQVNLSC